MAYSLPQFPLDVGVYDGPWLTKEFRLFTVGNLAIGRRNFPFPDFIMPDLQRVNGCVVLLLPPFVDVRDTNQAGAPRDIVEVPAGSGRWYGVLYVDDLGKGFPNEHRFAVMAKLSETVDPDEYPGLFWPTPMP